MVARGPRQYHIKNAFKQQLGSDKLNADYRLVNRTLLADDPDVMAMQIKHVTVKVELIRLCFVAVWISLSWQCFVFRGSVEFSFSLIRM